MSAERTPRRRRVASPCISVCVLDAQDVCTGCYRNAGEIARWHELDDAQRREVIRGTVVRMRRAGALFE